MIRLIFTIIRAFWRPRLGPNDESVLTSRVWPNDLDTNVFSWLFLLPQGVLLVLRPFTKSSFKRRRPTMNYQRYLSAMERGRADYFLRVPRVAFRLTAQGGIAGLTIKYLGPLHLFQKYSLKTRLVYWGDKFIHIEQCFENDGKLTTSTVVKLYFRGPAGKITRTEMEQIIGAPIALAPPSPEIEQMIKGLS